MIKLITSKVWIEDGVLKIVLGLRMGDGTEKRVFIPIKDFDSDKMRIIN